MLAGAVLLAAGVEAGVEAGVAAQGSEASGGTACRSAHGTVWQISLAV